MKKATDSNEWLTRYEPWMKLVARLAIEDRFQGKFGESDIVQQTMLEAWRDRHRFRGESEPERIGWLRAILARQIGHYARRFAGTQKRDLSREITIQSSVEQSSVRLENLLAADITSPSGQAANLERQSILATVLERLPEDYRDVIVLRNLQDLPHSEVASRMGRSEGAVRMLWMRALGQLRKEFEKLDIE